MGLEQVFYDMYNPDWFEDYNTQVTKYKDGTCRMFKSTSEIWKFTDEGKNELSEELKHRLKKKLGVPECLKIDESEDNIHRSIRRSKRQIKDLLFNNVNENSLFVTLTNGHRTGDADIDNASFKKKLLNRLNYLKKKYEFEYLIVPELHADKKYIHYHGIINGDIGHLSPAVDDHTGELIEVNNKQIYNIDELDDLGFTTASQVADYKKAVSYIANYVTEETILLKGYRRYYYSRGMEKPERIEIKLSDKAFEFVCDKIYDVGNGRVGYSTIDIIEE